MANSTVIKVITDQERDLLLLNRQVIDASPDLIAIIGDDHRYCYVNPAYAAMHKKKQEDFIGLHVRDNVGADVYEMVVEPNIRKCLAGEPVRYESRFDFGETGSYFMEVRYLPLTDEQNQVTRCAIITRDFSEQKKTLGGVLKSTEFLYNIINTLDDPVCVKDARFRYLIVNTKLCAMLGKTADELVGKTDDDLYAPEEAAALRKSDEFVLRTGKTDISEQKITWKECAHVVSIKKSRYVDSQSGRKCIVEAMRDITERTLTEGKLAFLATHDVLTGLPNRSLFSEIMRKELHAAVRKKHLTGVMLLDLDKFKEVNDTLGHKVGDLLIKSVARRLQGVLRQSDLVSRMGGDEFQLLIPELHQGREIDMIAEKILAAMQLPFACGKYQVTITASVGAALYPADGDDPETLVRHADIAMYAAKRAGRNTFARFRPGMQMDRQDRGE